MSQAMRCKPSELVHIDDPWLAYFWDEAVYMVSLYDLSKKAPKNDTFGAFG